MWWRSLVYYWRTNLAVAVGVAISVAVLSGALVVGESVRGSLRDLVGQRLGATEYVVAGDRFFRAELAADLAARLAANATPSTNLATPATNAANLATPDPKMVCPLIVAQGVVVHARTGARAYGVNVYGVDERFWRFHGLADPMEPLGRSAMGDGLADMLAVGEGDELLLRIETGREVAREWLFGRKEDIGKSVRLEAGRRLRADQLGEFTLQMAQGSIRSLFVPMRRLQQVLGQAGGANALLVASTAAADVEQVRAGLRGAVTLRDVGVTLRSLPAATGIAVESSRVLVDPDVVNAARAVALEAGSPAAGVFSYLANAIRAHGRDIPYSVMAAVDRRLLGTDASGGGVGGDPIWLNQWAWQDLKPAQGDPIEVDYFYWIDEGRLVTRTARFRLAGSIPASLDLDASFAPALPGVTDAVSIRNWDPPFPLDLGRIRPRDEEYWQRFRSTPKAVIPLEVGERLWSSRFGHITSLRIEGATQAGMASGLLSRLTPEQQGLTVTAVRRRGLDAAEGSTDFGEYFLYFSAFLVGAAVLLSALLFRLGIEQRYTQVGLLLAVGFPARAVTTLFLTEGAVVSLAGCVLGVLGALAYGAAIMAGLRTWWIGAVGTTSLVLHASIGALGMGAISGMLVSLVMIAVTLRGLPRQSLRALLAGVREPAPTGHRTRRWRGVVAGALAVAAGGLLAGASGGQMPAAGAFFGAGGLLLASMLCVAAAYLRRDAHRQISGYGWPALVRLGIRNAVARPGRSLLCISLIAAATFVIVSVEAFRREGADTDVGPSSGTGGYPLIARASVPIVADPNTPAGREALGIPASEVPELAPLRFVPFRVSPGDDVSCANLYAPKDPRILGGTRAFLEAGRFSFDRSLASTPEQRRNPWLLLDQAGHDGAVPAIGDANTIEYVLHRAVGDEVTVRGGRGTPVRLRLVGALRSSLLQGELIVSGAQFVRIFPDVDGFRFFLIDAPWAAADGLVAPLQERLADWGFAVERSRDRLAAYRQVENTYLSTFQSLGAMGLVLGTMGMGIVLLRNVLERRSQLALLRAIGYRRSAMALIIVAENALLMAAGLGCGTVAALVAALPALQARGGGLPLAMIAALVVVVFAAGLVSSVGAVAAVGRLPLVESLRSE